MTQHLLRRPAALLSALALTAAPLLLTAAAPAAASPRPLTGAGAPAPCTRPAPVRSTALPADDNATAQDAYDARVADLQARYPDRQLSPYRTVKAVGEGWRYGWTGGRTQHVTFLNRDGAMLVGTVFGPDPVRCPGPRPAVLVTEGITANEAYYWWQAQSLAEAGYVVLTFDYMNQGLSEASGHAADGTAVPPLGGDRGPDPATGFLRDAQDALDLLLSSPARPYRWTGPRLATDAPFATSNPFAAQVDPRFVGLTGHSEGARVASVLQGLDRRVGALVALDNLASRLKGDPGSSSSQCADGGLGTDELPVTPRVPAMGQAAPNNTACNDPELKKFAYEKWRAAGVPAMQVVVAGSRHTDWSPTPAVAEGDVDVPELAAYLTIAWFDRWLLKDPAAELRALGRSFDLFDHYTGAFRRTAADVYDTSFTSSATTGTNTCPDLRVACAAVAPVLPVERPGRAEDRPTAGDDGQEPAGRDDGDSVAAPVALSGAAPVTQPEVLGPASAPSVAVPQVEVPFAATAVGTGAPGAGALVALPAAGALLGLLVLVGARRHEGQARRLGAQST